MARYLLTQYPNNKPANQHNGKKGDKNKGNDPKPEFKDSNIGDTADAHVGDTTTTKKSNTPSRGASISAQIFETNEQLSRPSRTVKEILGAHPMNNDNFWGNTNPGDVSIDTRNSKEIMSGSHITDLHTHTNIKNHSN